ncbi:hypothetical protein DFH11DRAFT_830776 [Phellopilus nigrolimitatus]|nr:hypothetical protein DFH11DRAFT_830776 [Phellopilus nigrolimitatus]
MAPTEFDNQSRQEHIREHEAEALRETLPFVESIVPIVHEPPEPIVPEVFVEHRATTIPVSLDVRKLCETTKRVLMTGRLDPKWISKEPAFPPRHPYGRNAVSDVVRRKFWKHFCSLFPSYIPPSRSALTYVPVFRENYDFNTNTFEQQDNPSIENCKTVYALLRGNSPSSLMSLHTSRTLTHPALGIFPGKDRSVFDWDVSTSFLSAKYNGRRLTNAELNWTAFYPPLSRVRIGLNRPGGSVIIFTIIARAGLSPLDEHGDPYLSLRDVLHGIQEHVSNFVDSEYWSTLPIRVKALVFKQALASLTADQRERAVPYMLKMRRLAGGGYSAAAWSCFLDGVVEMDSRAFQTNVRFSIFLLGKLVFKCLANVEPNFYILETQ